jgi:hypothetical protein
MVRFDRDRFCYWSGSIRPAHLFGRLSWIVEKEEQEMSVPGEDLAGYIENVKAMKALLYQWKQFSETAINQVDNGNFYFSLGQLAQETIKLWDKIKGRGDPD